MARAVVALAAEVWISEFRSLEYPRGAVGCEQDRRDALETGVDLVEAARIARQILRESSEQVLQLADKIDRDGHWFGPTAG